jgi:hypothetical protein
MPHCSVENCERKYYAKGWCEMHYQRVSKYGHPEGGPTTHAPPEVRFWRYVSKAGDDDCWLWTGKAEKNGYGRFQIGGKGSPHIGAHRFSLQMATGEQPTVVMHKCDNPTCVNPRHLKAGTHKENTADMIAKGRIKPGRALGANNYNTKLTPDDVRAIRQRKGESAGSVGRDFDVGHKTVLAIWRGITWTHID